MWDGMNLVQLQWLFVAGAGLVIGALALVIGQRTWHRPEPARMDEPKDAQPDADPKGDPYRFSSAAEKRRVCRRKGRCVEIDLTDAAAKQPPWHGMVIDRSIKGVRVATDSDLPTGTVLNVRVAGLKPPMPWMEVTVVHSKPAGQGFELGCEFMSAPTWNILMMFG